MTKVLLLFLFLLAPTLAVLATSPSLASPDAAGVLGYAIVFLLVPLVFLPRVRLYFLLWLPFAVLVPVYAFLTVYYRSVPGDALVASAIHTDPLQTLHLLVGFGWIALLPVLFFIAYLWLALSIEVPLRITATFRKGLLAGLLGYASIGLLAAQYLAPHVRFPHLFDDVTANIAFPSNLLLSLSRVLAPGEGQVMSEVPGTLIAAPPPRIVVLVIGESVRSDHLGINGYARNTTPHLAAAASELISFRDVVSTANFTYRAVPNMVSMKAGEVRVTLPALFRKAGYATAWISNQDRMLKSRHADVENFAESSLDGHVRKDMALLPLFESFVRQGGERQFVVLHMYGSHIHYEERYGAESRVFTPTLRDIGVAMPNAGQVREAVNSYDNTIVEADRFLDGVLQSLRRIDTPAVVLFTSDHGENLFDDERQLFMHAQEMPTVADTRVPLVVWMNKGYRRQFGALEAGLRSNLAKPVSHASLFPTLLELGGIRWDQLDPAESFASGSFTVRPRFVVQKLTETINFDKLK